MEAITIKIDEIYVPAKHRQRPLDPKSVEEIAESIL